jgi:hypothetical protein
MTLVTGHDLAVSIDGTDYTDYILEYSESGGDKKVVKKKTFGNNYVTTVTGRSDYSVTLTFKYDTDLNMDILYEDDSPIDIVITLGTKTLTYNNAYAVGQVFNLENSEIATVELTYEVAAAEDNVYNKVVS